MPISKTLTAPNGVQLSVHKVGRIEISHTMTDAIVYVYSWPTQEAALSGHPHTWSWPLSVPLLHISSTPFESVELALLADGPFAGGSIIHLPSDASIESAKVRKNSEINAWRLAANKTSFTWQGKEIACDILSRGDIDAVANWVGQTGQLPPGFPGAWKAVDNSLIPIPDVATWLQFFGAMLSKGSENFLRSQALKAHLAALTTVPEVEAISWDMTIPEQPEDSQ